MEAKFMHKLPGEGDEELVDKEQVKKKIIEIVNNFNSDIHDANTILKEQDFDDGIKRSNEVQQAVVNRIKYCLKEDLDHAFDIDNFNILKGLLTVPEVLELDVEIQQLAFKVFDYHFEDHKPEKWSVFLNSFGLYGDKKVIEKLICEIKNSINHPSNRSPEELGEFLNDVWYWLGAESDDVKKSIENIIDQFVEYDLEIIKEKVIFDNKNMFNPQS